MQLYHERDKYIAHKDFFTTRMKELSRRTSIRNDRHEDVQTKVLPAGAGYEHR